METENTAIEGPVPQSELQGKSTGSVWLDLIQHRGTDGVIWINVRNTAANTGLHPQTVIAAIKALIDGRWLVPVSPNCRHAFCVHSAILAKFKVPEMRCVKEIEDLFDAMQQLNHQCFLYKLAVLRKQYNEAGTSGANPDLTPSTTDAKQAEGAESENPESED